MAYVNEKISKEDFEKYDLERINKRFPYGTPDDQWAIDREKKSWLRLYYRSEDRDNFGTEISTDWDFYWEGTFIPIETKTLDKIAPSKNNGIFYWHIKVLEIEIPETIQRYTKGILKDFREALEVSKVGLGTYSKRETIYKIDLEYNGEVL
jgi:hypothetical protein